MSVMLMTLTSFSRVCVCVCVKLPAGPGQVVCVGGEAL